MELVLNVREPIPLKMIY